MVTAVRSRRMRFLFIAPIPFFHERGACIRSLNMIASLSEMGHAVDVLTYPVGRDVRIKNVRIIRVKTSLRPPLKAKMTVQRLLTDCLLRKKALELSAANAYDCVIGKTPIGRIISRKVKENAGIPLIIDVVEPAAGMVSLYSRKGTFAGKYISKIIRLLLNPLTLKLLRNLELKNYRSADVILANWDLVKKEVERESGRKCTLLYDTIPAPLVRKPVGEARSSLATKEEKMLLYTGASTPQQGIDVMINSLPLLRNKNAKLVIVGPREEAYVRLAAAQGLSGRVVFTGSVKLDELPRYFKAADVLLTAYSSGGNNATVKLLFYLFQGKPIIASDVPQYRQIVDESVVFLAKPEPGEFARVIDRVLSDPALADARARKAQEYARRKFSKKAYARRLASAVAAATRTS